MNIICRNITKINDDSIIERLEDKYDISFPKSIREFFLNNNGGTPLKKEITVNGTEYEIRCFLSFNDDEYNSIKKPLATFQENTHGKIAPVAKDSGDNYFCLNVENEKVYYWDKDENMYYNLADSFDDFIKLLL